MHQSARLPLAAAVALALAACGGGGGSGGSASAVTSSGTITGFGSFYVNGVRYTTNSGTEIEFEDEGRVTEDRLRLGMKVTIKGTRSGTQGTASKILFDAELKGIVDGPPTVDATNPKVGSFAVGGFTVTTSDDTTFDEGIADLNGLSQGDFVEISAYPTTSGFIATRVELETDAFGPGDFEVKGVVSDQGFSPGVSFEIQGVTILVGNAVVEPGVEPGVLVEVKGDPVSGNIDADTVEVEDDLFDDDFDDEIELEGILERVNGMIFIAGRQVSDPNGLLDSFNDGDKVEVELARNGDELIVVEVELEVEDTIRTEDDVAQVNGDTFTTRLGLSITPSGGVRREDDLRDDDQITVNEFMLNLQPNDRIEAEGFPNGSGVTWTEIEREDSSDTGCRLRGHAQSGSAPLVIQGVQIDTTGAQFEDENDQPIASESAFFTALSAGDVVEAKTDVDGNCTTGSLIAEEVSFESADD